MEGDGLSANLLRMEYNKKKLLLLDVTRYRGCGEEREEGEKGAKERICMFIKRNRTVQVVEDEIQEV